MDDRDTARITHVRTSPLGRFVRWLTVAVLALSAFYGLSRLFSTM